MTGPEVHELNFYLNWLFCLCRTSLRGEVIKADIVSILFNTGYYMYTALPLVYLLWDILEVPVKLRGTTGGQHE